MSVLIYLHLKNYVFPISLPFPLYQGNTLFLTNVATSLVDLYTACKNLRCMCVVAGMSDSKTQELYYL